MPRTRQPRNAKRWLPGRLSLMSTPYDFDQDSLHWSLFGKLCSVCVLQPRRCFVGFRVWSYWGRRVCIPFHAGVAQDHLLKKCSERFGVGSMPLVVSGQLSSYLQSTGFVSALPRRAEFKIVADLSQLCPAFFGDDKLNNPRAVAYQIAPEDFDHMRCI